MNRFERLKEVVVRSGSPLGNHPINQREIKTEVDCGRSFYQPTSKKILTADKKRARRHQEVQQHETFKTKRIADRVRVAFGGYDGFDPIILDREIAYLKRNGVDIQTVLETSSSED